MAAENIQPLVDQVKQTEGVLESVLAWEAGTQARQDAAVAAALALGATQAELQPLVDEFAAQAVVRQKVADAIAANPGPTARR